VHDTKLVRSAFSCAAARLGDVLQKAEIYGYSKLAHRLLN
jgi:hypothetical protein